MDQQFTRYGGFRLKYCSNLATNFTEVPKTARSEDTDQAHPSFQSYTQNCIAWVMYYFHEILILYVVIFCFAIRSCGSVYHYFVAGIMWILDLGHRFSLKSWGSWIFKDCFVARLWHSWILNCFIVGSWRSWMLFSFCYAILDPKFL